MNRTISGFIKENFKKPYGYVLMNSAREGTWTPEVYQTMAEIEKRRSLKWGSIANYFSVIELFEGDPLPPRSEKIGRWRGTY